MGIDTTMSDLERIDTDELIGNKDILEENKEVIHRFKQFCEFFRRHINSDNSIKYSLTPELYSESGLNEDIVNDMFRHEVIGMTNYIWNEYSREYNLEEAIVNVSSLTIDKLEQGPAVDESSLKYMDLIDTLKLLEGMGNEFKDEVIESEMEDELSAARSLISLKRATEDPPRPLGPKRHKTGTVRKRKKRTKKKLKKVDTSRVVTEDLGSMKFMVGGTVVSF